jgi:deoxyguanosine kinase
MPTPFYIVFEGPIAAGKTTHAQLLADKVSAKLLLEDFPGNESLADFYGDKYRWALPMQLWFLVSRHAQLSTIVTPVSEAVIVDYSCLKNQMFAELLLKDRELRLYNQLSSIFKANVAHPDLLVYLDASNEILLDRIHTRNRPYEKTIDANYLDSLRDAYEKELDSSQFDVVRYDTSNLDLMSEADVDALQRIILNAVAKN